MLQTRRIQSWSSSFRNSGKEIIPFIGVCNVLLHPLHLPLAQKRHSHCCLADRPASLPPHLEFSWSVSLIHRRKVKGKAYLLNLIRIYEITSYITETPLKEFQHFVEVPPKATQNEVNKCSSRERGLLETSLELKAIYYIFMKFNEISSSVL